MANGELPISEVTTPTNGYVKVNGLSIGAANIDGRIYYGISLTPKVFALLAAQSGGDSGALYFCCLSNPIAFLSTSSYNDSSNANSLSFLLQEVTVDGNQHTFYRSVAYPSLTPIDGALVQKGPNDNSWYVSAYRYLAEMDRVKYPITYVPINSVLSGPESAASGETVNVSVSFPDGYIYQEKGVSIYNKDGAIPFTYTDGTLTFTMP